MKNLFIILTLSLLAIACGGSDNPGEEETPTPVTPPSAASLVFPENGELCTEAKSLDTSNDTYIVEFRWIGDASPSNKVTYTVNLTNEDSNTSKMVDIEASSGNVSLDIPNIIPNTNYSWEVFASKKGTDVTASSDKQTFISVGIVEVSFVPNTAKPINPTTNEVLTSTTAVTIEWEGKDDNNDILEYDIYFGNSDPPAKDVTVTKEVTSKEFTVTSNTIYFWKIVTRDEKGNESTSATFKFTVL